MVVLGYDSTVPVTMADMIHHSRAARRGARDTFLLTDMPFLTYQISPAQAMENAARLVQDGGCEGVKVEGGEEIAPQVRALVRAGIPVCGHVGLTPQSATALSGYKVQGRTAEAARKLLHDALALEEAGAFMIVLECIPAQVAEIDHQAALHPDHRHRRRRRLRRAGAGLSRHPGALRALRAQIRQAVRDIGRESHGGSGRLRPRGAQRRLSRPGSILFP
jgi:hypothetical protein